MNRERYKKKLLPVTGELLNVPNAISATPTRAIIVPSAQTSILKFILFFLHIVVYATE
jgi:hypothetical protein